MKFTIVFRVQCYVSVITEKYDLSFQLTYHTLAYDFQTSAEGHAVLDMSRIQQTVVLEGFNVWGGRGYDDFVPGEITKTAPSGDETA